MKWTEALTELTNGNGVRLPEWTGYWFIDKNVKTIMAFTRTGDTVRATLDKFLERDDWEVVTEGLGFDWALLAMKSGKRVQREAWKGEYSVAIFDKHFGQFDKDNIRKGGYMWWYEDIMATDWVLA